MKNKYFGDVNDYLKYGILRCFTESGFHVGVCWMLTPDDERSDGGKIGYLRQPKQWRKHDPELFDFLCGRMDELTGRSVNWIEDPSILANTCFFNEIVPDREPRRSSWFAEAMEDLNTCNLIFFDPDNGIEVPSVPRNRKNSSKYVYWDELRIAWDRGASLLVFQHYPRKKRSEYISQMVDAMQKNLGGANVTPLHTSNVLFLLAIRDEHLDSVNQAIELAKHRWTGRVHWEI